MARIIGFVYLTLSLTGCVHYKLFEMDSCVTACGMRMYGSKDCEGFQRAEDRAVGVYDFFLNSIVTCDKLDGWVVHAQPGKQWMTCGGRKDGLTYCGKKIIQVGTDQWSQSVLSEELLHAVECDKYTADSDPHLKWKNSWQYEAIRRAR